MIKAMYIFIALIIILGVISFFTKTPETVPVENNGNNACTQEAKICPDGSSVGREGPNCEFAACPPVETNNEIPEDVSAHIESKSDLIKLTTVVPVRAYDSPLVISGEARGTWYFEASFPVVLTNWDGLILAEGIATADGEWMTEDFVPFTATLNFDNPYNEGDPDFMKKGILILKKDNPSGLPEHDDALEVPVQFAP